MAARAAKTTVAIHWFRKGLRLHDNPALAAAAASGAATVMPLFILDPRFADPARVGARRYQPVDDRAVSTLHYYRRRFSLHSPHSSRYRFLLEALADLDASLRARCGGLLTEALHLRALASDVKAADVERDHLRDVAHVQQRLAAEPRAAETGQGQPLLRRPE